ncbi:DUF6968 family protein [Nocardia sp. NPDC003482]
MNDEPDVVVTRTVQDGDREVRIEVTDPRPDAGTGGWRCAYRIDGFDTQVVRGHDGLAAVYAALVGIGEDLARANARGAHYTVFGRSDLGFPTRRPGRAPDER